MKLESLQKLMDVYGVYIEKAAAKHGIDQSLLAGLIWQESRGDPQAVSSCGAFGLTQIMPATARDMGYHLNSPKNQIEAGADYLAWIKKHFTDDHVLMLAAYNAGVGRLKNDRWKKFKETREYVIKVLNNSTEYAELLKHKGVELCGQESSIGSAVKKRTFLESLRALSVSLRNRVLSRKKRATS